MALVPFVVLLRFLLGGAPFTLAIPPILAASLLLAALVVTIVAVDGEADMVDGAALVGLYVIIAAIFWWGCPVGRAERTTITPRRPAGACGEGRARSPARPRR